MLDDGNVFDWFGSPFIVKMSLVAGPQLFWPNIVRDRSGDGDDPAIGDRDARDHAQEAPGASGLFNMMRTLGGAIGTATIETFFTKREQFHSAIITPDVSLLEPATRRRLADLQQVLHVPRLPRSSEPDAPRHHRRR